MTRRDRVLRIAIQRDSQLLTSGRRQSFSPRWIELLAAAGHEGVLVDVYKPGFFESLAGCDGFMWWFAHLPHPRNFGRRMVHAIEHGLGVPVFPSRRTIWHFDDKIGQQYLLEAAGIPVPETHVFWRKKEALRFCRDARYPMVIKLAGGIQSENVMLLRSAAEAEYWVLRLFRSGAVSLKRRGLIDRPRIMLRRVVDAGRLILAGVTPPTSDRTELQKGYVLLQQFVPGNAFDTRVTVIGNRAFASRRENRPGDFRASGSGRIDWNPSPIDEDAVRLGLRVARTLRTQSVAVDVLRRDGQPVINEISYYFEGWAVQQCPGHWELGPDRDAAGPLQWVDGHVRPEDALLEDFVDEVGALRFS